MEPNMIERVQLEERLINALSSLWPESEESRAWISKYTPYEMIAEIPADEIYRICQQIEKEKVYMAFLGEFKYFDSITIAQKIMLYKAAILELEKQVVETNTAQGVTFEAFKQMWNRALKECTVSTPFALGEETAPKEAKQPPKKKKEPKITKAQMVIIKSAVEHLNKKTGKNFRASAKPTQKQIVARINEGYELQNFIQVINNCCEKWGKPAVEPGDKDMSMYLRPATLFGTKFEAYLNEGPTGETGGVKAEKDMLVSQIEYKPLDFGNRGE